MWKHTHSKLYELATEVVAFQNSEKNYFHEFEEEIYHPLSKDRLQALEHDLSCLDITSWNYLKKKIIKNKCILNPHKTRYWQQFSDYLNEIKGYIYLRQNNYDKIHFIPESDKQQTPDFYAVGENGEVLLEVKTINISNIEVDYRSPLTPIKCKEIIPGLNEGLKSQVVDKINKASRQLLNYRAGNSHAMMIMLCVNFDDGRKVIDHNIKELRKFVALKEPDDTKIQVNLGYQL